MSYKKHPEILAAIRANNFDIVCVYVKPGYRPASQMVLYNFLATEYLEKTGPLAPMVVC